MPIRHYVNEICAHLISSLFLAQGPYVYSEKRHKKDIVFAENGTIVSFNEIQVFKFVPEMSAGSEDEELRLLNVPFVTVLNQAKVCGGSTMTRSE